MDAPALVSHPVPAPLLACQLCDISFDTAEERRQHAKSEWHVYKIRCRIAEPGITVSPPGSGSNPTNRRVWKSTSEPPQADEDSEIDTSSDEDIDFIPEECLFCNQTRKDFDENLSHMHQVHSLVVPFSSLAVDPQTFISFLHMVIFSYQECICCGKRCRTVEAVQQHMTSTGHCRFNVEDMGGFYNVDSLGQQTVETCRPDEHTLRLPSGKLLGHRSATNSTPRRRPRERQPSEPSTLPASASQQSQQSSPRTQTLAKTDLKAQALTTQLSQLRTSDQASLAHLPESQQRALLLAQKKELDGARRTERRARGRVDDVRSKSAINAASKYFGKEDLHKWAAR